MMFNLREQNTDVRMETMAGIFRFVCWFVSKSAVWCMVLTGIVMICSAAVTDTESGTPPWHTPPEKWSEPRMYQTAMEDEFSDRVSLDRCKTEKTFNLKVLSANNAYWFAAEADWPETPEVECRGSEFLITSSDATIYVFTEREHLLCVHFREHYRNFNIRVQWINERLLHIRVWWGRVSGLDYIVDVENERVIHSEMVYSGENEYLSRRDPD